MNDQGEDDVREHWGLARRGAATSCRSVRISASFAASVQTSSASQPNTRTSVKYASRKATASHHAGLAGTVMLRGDPRKVLFKGVTELSASARSVASFG